MRASSKPVGVYTAATPAAVSGATSPLLLVPQPGTPVGHDPAAIALLPFVRTERGASERRDVSKSAASRSWGGAEGGNRYDSGAAAGQVFCIEE
jgi:hypothetical protein